MSILLLLWSDLFCNLRHIWMQFHKYFGLTMKHWHVFLTLRSRHADTGVVILDCATRWLFIEYLADYSQIYFRLLIPSFTLFLAKGKHLSTAELEHHVSTYLLIRTGGRSKKGGGGDYRKGHLMEEVLFLHIWPLTPWPPGPPSSPDPPDPPQFRRSCRCSRDEVIIAKRQARKSFWWQMLLDFDTIKRIFMCDRCWREQT